MEAPHEIVKSARIMKQDFQSSKHQHFGHISASFMCENLAWNVGKKVQDVINVQIEIFSKKQ